MLEFLYTHKYNGILPASKNSLYGPSQTVAMTHISLYALGDKYDIPTLCQYSAQKFRGQTVAELSGREILGCVPLIYSSTPSSNRTLRDLAVPIIVGTTGTMNRGSPIWNAMMQHADEIKEFREDLILGLIKKPRSK